LRVPLSPCCQPLRLPLGVRRVPPAEASRRPGRGRFWW